MSPRRCALWAAACSVVPRLASAQEAEPVEAPAPTEAEPEAPPHDDDPLEVIVEATSSEPRATTVIGEEALERAAGDDLAETLSEVPGVVAARGTADSSKPMIRGQIERRLLVLFDGVRHESQKWGADHATEIDPFAAGSIRVIRGAAGVRYGPDAIGGVVLVDPPPMRDERGVGGKVGLIGALNGPRGVAAARVDWSPAEDWSFRVEGNYGRGGAVSTPTYVLGNTASETWNLGGSAQWSHGDTSVQVTARHYDLRAGVCFCARAGTSEDFLAALDRDVPLGAESWDGGFTIERPYQAVGHDLVLARLRDHIGPGLLTLTYGYQHDHRREYDQVRSSVTGPQYDFRLRTHTVDAAFTRDQGELGPWTIEGGVGLSGLYQENVYSGLPLVPNHRARTAGAFAWEHWSTGPVSMEVGGRLDGALRTVFLAPSVFDADVARGVLDPDDCDVTDTAARCPHAWSAGSLSAGGVWRIVADTLDLRLDLSSASRFPNPDELYSNGTAPTLPVYAVGDPGLGAETTWGATPTLTLTLPVVQAELSAFANLTDDYVLFAPELGEDGEILFDVTIRGAFPRFTYRAIDALFSGVDGQVGVRLSRTLTAGVQGAVVRGVDRSTGEALPFVPGDRARGSFGYTSPQGHSFAEASVDVLGRARPSSGDLAPPPDGAVLLGAQVGQDVHVGKADLSVALEVWNLLNAQYRDPTSLLRYYADEPGRQITARVETTF